MVRNIKPAESKEKEIPYGQAEIRESPICQKEVDSRQPTNSAFGGAYPKNGAGQDVDSKFANEFTK